jgi:hypothetical protein
MTTLAAVARRATAHASLDDAGPRSGALAAHPPPAELGFLADRIGAAATLALIEAHGGTRVKIPREPNQGSVLARTIGLDAARGLAAWRAGETVKVPLAKVWRIRVYRAEGLSYSQIARKLGVGESVVHKYLQLGGLTSRQQGDLFI